MGAYACVISYDSVGYETHYDLEYKWGKKPERDVTEFGGRAPPQNENQGPAPPPPKSKVRAGS